MLFGHVFATRNWGNRNKLPEVFNSIGEEPVGAVSKPDDEGKESDEGWIFAPPEIEGKDPGDYQN